MHVEGLFAIERFGKPIVRDAEPLSLLPLHGRELALGALARRHDAEQQDHDPRQRQRGVGDGDTPLLRAPRPRT